ncbi:hypothetical protein HYU11_02550 [Candidatus Woesearchaeota archaeon]|nr:hypothetical protein [Candidatus Woesearchaeota archaeon]
MKYQALLTVEGDKDLIFEAFSPESKNKKSSRSEYTISKSREGIKFAIHAGDATAFRAIINSITRQLSVIEKATRIT